MATQLDPIAIIPTQCILGEGPVWDHRLGVLWFTDVQNSQLLRLEWPSAALVRFDLPERLGSLGLTRNPSVLVCAFASGFALLEPTSGDLSWLHRTEPRYRGIRMNDGRVDRHGRFWSGSMVEDAKIAVDCRGTLYRLDGARADKPRKVLSGMEISNSICFSPAGDRLYVADSPTQEIRSFTLDASTGEVTGGEVFVRLGGNAYPDGSDIDAAGRLWNAEWGSGRVTAYNQDGSTHQQIHLPVRQVSCIAFGGAGLDHLFVTTARDGMSEDALDREPHAGDLFVYRIDGRGLPASIFEL